MLRLVLCSILLCWHFQSSHCQPDNTTAPVAGVPNNTLPVSWPEIYGMRVELKPKNEFGYSEKGICIVNPDDEMTVVIYGSNIENIEKLIFIATNSCDSEAVRTIFSHDFFIEKPHKAAFHLNLPLMPPESHSFKICLFPKNAPENYLPKPVSFFVGRHVQIDDYTTHITTEMPPNEHIFDLRIQVAIIVFLLCLSALFSGLTLGLMSMTPQELELVMKSGSTQEAKFASKILPIRRKGNLLLCALLLGNVIVNAAISILFGDITSGMLALIISSLGIVIFGEIVPQSICVKKGLAVGAYTITITQFFIFLTFPLAWPISKLLDWLLGDEYTAYDRKRLMELMKMSIKDNATSNELKIAVGAMEIADKVVRQVMTKIEDVFMLPETTILNAKAIAEIIKMGYTRIPVYSDGDVNNITDILFVKDLALIDPDDNFSVRTVCGYHKHPVKFVLDDTPLSILLEAFKKGEGHLAMVKRLVVRGADEKDPAYELVGICTLEDIVEEILQAEIVDESDAVTDNVNRTKRKNTAQPRDMTRFFDKEAPLVQISMHLQMVAMQWLVANTAAFKEQYISKEVLERLVKNSARQVDISSLKAISQVSSMEAEPFYVPKLAKLYTKDEPSDRFILILEGRVQVTIGQGGMMFEAGPWHSFGNEILDKLTEGAATLTRNVSIIDSSDLVVRRPDLMFKPDFSVVVKVWAWQFNSALQEDCTYLEVTVTKFIQAYKSSLMQKEKDKDADKVSLSSNQSSPPLRKKSLIADPDMEISAKNIRRPTIAQAREAVEALNQMEAGHKFTNGKEEEMRLLKPASSDEE